MYNKDYITPTTSAWQHGKERGSKALKKMFFHRGQLITRKFLMFRQILMEGPLSLVDSGKPTEMFIILFDDMLLITRRKKALSKKVQFT